MLVGQAKRLEEERKTKAREEKWAEDDRRRSQIPVAIWHGERCRVLRPDKHMTWGEFKTLCFGEMSVASAPQDCRLVLRNGVDAVGPGILGATLDAVDMTPLKNVETLEQYSEILIDEKAPGDRWPNENMYDDENDQTTVVAYSDVDGEEVVHLLTVPRSTKLEDLKAAIATELKVEDGVEGIMLCDLSGDHKQNGFNVSFVAGPSSDFSLDPLLDVMAAVDERDADITATNIVAELPSVAPPRYAPRELVLGIFNMTGQTVTVQRLTKGFYYNAPDYFKTFATLQPGHEMAHSEDSMADRQLTRRTIGKNTSYFEMRCNPAITWRVLIGGYQPLYAQYCRQWNNPEHDRVNIFIEGEGPAAAVLGVPRLLCRVKKAPKIYKSTFKQLPVGHHNIPIYQYAGRPDDFSNYVFDMEIDENMLVRDFKVELAKKLHEDAGMAPDEVDAERLRVREMAQGTWIGSVFMDDQKLVTPVTKFNGSEKFAFNVLRSGPEPRQEGQAAITIFKYSPSSMTMGDYSEMLVEPALTLDQFRQRLADLDPDIDDARDVALATTTQLNLGSYQVDLNGTVWDMRLLKWDWDRAGSAMYPVSSTLLGVKDMDCYYYHDVREEQMVLTKEQEETLKKRSMIEKRKKANAGKKKHNGGAETGVVMNVAKRSPDAVESPPVIVVPDSAGSTEEGVPLVVGSLIDESTVEIPLARTISAGVRADMLSNSRLNDDQKARLQQLDTQRQSSRSDEQREREAWLASTSSREAFAGALAQRDALRAMEGWEGWVQVPGPETLEQLQKSDISAEKARIEAEVAQLRQELGL